MRQVIIAGQNDALGGGATEYNGLMAGRDWVAGQFEHVITTPGTISNLLVELSGAPGAGTSYIFTLMLNGAPTALVATIANADTQGQDTANSVSVVAGDKVSLRCTFTGAPANPTARWSSLFTGTVAKQSLIMGQGYCDKNFVSYAPIMYGNSPLAAAEASVYCVCPTSGKIKNLYVNLTASPGVAPDAFRYTLMVDGVPSTLTVTVTAPDTSGSDIAHEVTVAAGQLLDLMVEPLNAPSNSNTTSWGMTFEADIDGESIIVSGGSDQPHQVASEYNYLSLGVYNFVWSSPESNYYHLGQPTTLRKLYVYLSAAPGAGKSRSVSIRVNATSRITVNIADAAQTGNNVADTWALANFDHLDLETDPVGSPANADVHWGMVGYISPGGSIGVNASKLVAAALI